MTRLPIGEGGAFLEEREKYALPAEEVENTVLWVNPAFAGTLPFELKEGEPTKLAAFLSPKEREGQRVFYVSHNEAKRGRSGLWQEVVFRDQGGIHYRDVDQKGVGCFEVDLRGWHSRASFRVSRLSEALNPKRVRGFLNSELAFYDKDNSEKLLAHGIRTYRTVAIIGLEEIIDEAGEKISVEKARERGIIPEGFEPVIQVRAYPGTRERIPGVSRTETNKRTAKHALKDAKTLVAAELGKDPKEFSTEDYLIWFAETLGKQVARLHQLNLVHKGLFPHDITLDCCLVDLDSMNTTSDEVSSRREQGQPTTEGELYMEDVRAAIFTVSHLAEWAKILKPREDLPSPEYLKSTLEKSYNQELLKSMKPRNPS